MQNETSGYHLFLEPEEASRNVLAHDIAVLAGRYGGPVFVPHVTLTGPVNGEEAYLVEQTRALAASVSALTLTLGTYGGESSYFRALYLNVLADESLSALRTRAEAVFGAGKEPYLPHLSLFYGSIDVAQRAQMLAEIANRACMTVAFPSLALYCTEGTAESWRRIAVFRFTAHPQR